MRYTPRTKNKWPVKYIVRVREVENDQRTEHAWEYLDAKEAATICNQAKTNGFFSYVQKVADWKQLERV